MAKQNTLKGEKIANYPRIQEKFASTPFKNLKQNYSRKLLMKPFAASTQERVVRF